MTHVESVAHGVNMLRSLQKEAEEGKDVKERIGSLIDAINGTSAVTIEDAVAYVELAQMCLADTLRRNNGDKANEDALRAAQAWVYLDGAKTRIEYLRSQMREKSGILAN